MIHAIKDGKKNSFTEAQWNLMPKDKYGWEKTSTQPAELTVEINKRDLKTKVSDPDVEAAIAAEADKNQTTKTTKK